MARRSFKAGTLMAPLPAVMVTVGDMEKNNIITVAWTGILSSDPPRAYISVRPQRYSHAFLEENGEFVINLTTEKLAASTDYAGIYTGAKVDKFEKCSLSRVPSEKVLPPTIAESPIALECRVFQVIKSGTHDIFLADILSVSCDEELLDENGRICYERAGLIAYSHGEYYALGDKLGKFGFSTDKSRPVQRKNIGKARKKHSASSKPQSASDAKSKSGKKTRGGRRNG